MLPFCHSQVKAHEYTNYKKVSKNTNLGQIGVSLLDAMIIELMFQIYRKYLCMHTSVSVNM